MEAILNFFTGTLNTVAWMYILLPCVVLVRHPLHRVPAGHEGIQGLPGDFLCIHRCWRNHLFGGSLGPCRYL